MMKKGSNFRSLLIFLLGFLTTGFARKTVTPGDAAKFTGQEKTVCGMVAGAHHAVLMLGADNSETLSGKEICGTGMIRRYQGKPEIVVKDPPQIRAK
jgi:hypothetical protein